MTKKERLRQQTELQYEMQKAGLNLVDCGNCGSTLIHETTEGDITCPYCEYTSEPCDFPDHFHEGFEQSAEFQDNKEFEIDPYCIYVTLHLMDCSSESFAQKACDIKWNIASEVYQKFIDSKYNVETKSEYDCIVEFLTHEPISYD